MELKENELLLLQTTDKEGKTPKCRFSFPKYGNTEDSINKCIVEGLVWGEGKLLYDIYEPRFLVLKVNKDDELKEESLNFPTYSKGEVVLFTDSRKQACDFILKYKPDAKCCLLPVIIEDKDNHENNYEDKRYYGDGGVTLESSSNAEQFSKKFSRQIAGRHSKQKAGYESVQISATGSTQFALGYSVQKTENDSKQTLRENGVQIGVIRVKQYSDNNSVQISDNNSIQESKESSTQITKEASKQTSGNNSNHIIGNDCVVKSGKGSVVIHRWVNESLKNKVKTFIFGKDLEPDKMYFFSNGGATLIKNEELFVK